jgi:glyoxylase-like metal-dependent hydrolase (beta-lactamase superfamily II)
MSKHKEYVMARLSKTNASAMLISAAVALTAASGVLHAASHDDHSNEGHSHDNEDHHSESPSFSVSELGSEFYLLQGKGGNILASKGADGVLLIDSDYADMSPALESTLSELGGELQYVINTHWHGDHTQGNQTLGKTADIIAHDNVYTRLNSKQEIKLFNMVSEPYPSHALPDITFDSKLTLRFNGQTIELVHAANGHTDGDSVVFFDDANIVHMGDHFFNGIFPFVDVETKGSVRGTAKNIESLLGRIKDDTQIIPGHGPLANKADLIAFHDMLLGTAAEVELMMKDGKSLEAIQKAGLSDTWDSWAGGFLDEPTWIAIVHSSLEADAK